MATYRGGAARASQPTVNEIEGEFRDGYHDGGDATAPEPGPNRSAAYRHSFEVRRAEVAGKPLPAGLSRERARRIEEEEI